MRLGRERRRWENRRGIAGKSGRMEGGMYVTCTLSEGREYKEWVREEEGGADEG